jgi:hypothetical protein
MRLGPTAFSSAASSISAGDQFVGMRADEGGGAPSSFAVCHGLYASATATRCRHFCPLAHLHVDGESLSVFPATSFVTIPSGNVPTTVPSSSSSSAGPIPSEISR